MSHILDNRDVCGEIILYFNVSLEDDKPGDVKAKRRVLLSLALASRKLTDVALDELWKSMTTLEPIVEVFNTSSSSGNASTNVTLSYHDSLEYWETRISANGYTSGPVPRVLTYLSRIRYLRFPSFPQYREYNLWKTLSSFGWLNPLCPNLRSLALGVDVTARAAYNIIPLISSTIRDISLHCSTSSTHWNQWAESSGEAAASIILDLLKGRNVEVANISFRGFTSYRIIQRILVFPNLRSAVIPLASETRVTVDHIAEFPDMLKLTSLDIHLGLYDALESVGSWFETMISLGSLALRGPLLTILQCLRDRRPIVSIHSLALHLDVSQNTRNMDPLIRQISAMFPGIRALHLEVTSQGHIDLLSVTQILTLRQRPMETLVLRRCLNIDPELDLLSIVEAWPTLRSLHLEGSNGPAPASAILPFISRNASFLRDVTLPVGLSSLAIARRSPLGLGECVCPLQRLNFVNFHTHTFDFNQTMILAHNLVTLFPRISTVTAPGTGEPDVLHQVQAAIEAMQMILASPSRRSDKLFQYG